MHFEKAGSKILSCASLLRHTFSLCILTSISIDHEPNHYLNKESQLCHVHDFDWLFFFWLWSNITVKMVEQCVLNVDHDKKKLGRKGKFLMTIKREFLFTYFLIFIDKLFFYQNSKNI